MSDAQVEIYETAGNLALVRVIKRRYPGILVQGDSLKIMSDLVQEVCDEFATMDYEAAQDSLRELNDAIMFMVKEYERMMANANFNLPY